MLKNVFGFSPKYYDFCNMKLFAIKLMPMNKIYILLVLIVFGGYSVVYSQQNISPCNAQSFDDSGNITGKNPLPIYKDNTTYPTCSGTDENTLWYKFEPTKSQFDIKVKATDCIAGKGELAIDATLFHQRSVACGDLIPTKNACVKVDNNSESTLSLNVPANRTYWLSIDGIEGAQCNFTVAYLPTDYNIQIGTLNVQFGIDENKDCQINATELPFDEAKLLIKQGSKTIQTLNINRSGVANVDLPFGQYDFEIAYSTDLWKTCLTNTSFQLGAATPKVALQIPVQKNIGCPKIEANLSTYAVKDNNNEVKYVLNCKNIGTEIALNAKARLKLDNKLKLNSVNAPYSVKNDIIEIALGDIAVLGSKQISIGVVQNVPNTLLRSAFINQIELLPNTACSPPNPNWSGANIKLDGKCIQDSVVLTVANTGNAKSAKNAGIIIEDMIIGLTKYIDDVNPSDSIIIAKIPANGKTIRFEMPQEPFHPSKSKPSITVEGCGKNNSGTYSVGFANLFPQDDDEYNIDVDLMELEQNVTKVGILGFPKGYDTAHLINKNQEIEYLIRYSNPNVDTISRLYIVDTLSAGFDLTTLRACGSSHPYQLEIVDNKILVFNFENIKLAPEKSLGGDSLYVKFSVGQQKDLINGTKLTHSVHFYNNIDTLPTSTAIFHTIGENFITLSSIELFLPDIVVKTYPNPATTEAQISIENIEAQKLNLEIFDLSARMILSKQSNENRFSVDTTSLPKGTYFFRISNSNKIIANGKLMVH